MSKSRKTAPAEAKLAKADVKHGAVAVVSTSPLLTAAQIENDCPALVQDLGKRLAAHYDKMVKYEDKAEENKIAMAQLLTQAKKACDEAGFTAFRKRFCPKLGRSRAHELLLIASGKKTIEETKSATRERVKKYRAAKKAAAPKVSTPGPSVTVTDEDPVVSAEKRKAEYADPPKISGKIAAVPEAAPIVAEPEAEPMVEEGEAEEALKAKINDNMEDNAKVDRQPSAKALADNSGGGLTAQEKAAKRSAHNLAEFTMACRTYLPKITIETDRQKARLLVSELTGIKPMKAA
jgi:hypothetical protein